MCVCDIQLSLNLEPEYRSWSLQMVSVAYLPGGLKCDHWPDLVVSHIISVVPLIGALLQIGV